MEASLPSPRLVRKASSIPPALTPVLKTLGLEEDDPEDVFEIHSKEGAGAFGRVFRASYRRDPTKLAALKVIPVALEAGQRGEDIANVRREIEFLRECDHPNVVAFFGAYYKDQALWVAMEYCGGGSVGDVSRRRRLDEQEIAVITRGALKGLAYLHSRKKIHRDIKGGNILLTSEGEVKIADFGVSAQLKDTMSRRGTFVGTPYWMSPEMIQDSDYDYKSDIWSLGITLIELADQRPPLFDEHPMRVLIQIPRNPPPSVKNPHAWSPLLIQFLQFCLRKDPRERPSATECLDHAFIQRVAHVEFIYAEGLEGRRAMQVNHGNVDGRTDANNIVASLVVTNSTNNESDALADDVTLKACAARPPRPQEKTHVDTSGTGDSGRRLSIRLIEPSESCGGDVGTPRSSESVVEEAWDAVHPAVVTSSRSSRSEDDEDTTDENDAGAEGFTFRTTPPSPPKAGPPPQPRLEMVSGDELLQLSVDDSFELPATTLISRIQAAAATLAGRPTPAPQLSQLPLPLHSAPSPTLKDRHVGRTSVPAGGPRSGEATTVANTSRDLRSFSRTNMTVRRSLSTLKPTKLSSSPTSADARDQWDNPLTQLMVPCQDRVNSLLSSISSSKSELIAQRQEFTSPMQLTIPSNSLRESVRLQPLDPNCSIASSSKFFIGSPFRVSHQVNVRYNTVDAKFEGVPTDWESVHKQFGIPLAQMRGRSNATDRVPALVQMLRRELLRRDGLDCKYIYRVSPDQSEIQRAKEAINTGTFEPVSVGDPHVFASLIKHWLRDLPNALLGTIPQSELAVAVHKLVKGGTVEDPLATDTTKEPELALSFPEMHEYVTRVLLSKLPTAESNLLLWLLDHMNEVVAKSSSNGMTGHSLAVVMAPNIYRWASTTPYVASLISRQVATLLRVLLSWRRRSLSGVGCSSERGSSLGGTERSQNEKEFTSLSENSGVGSSLSLRSGSSGARDSSLSTILRSSTRGSKSSYFASTLHTPEASHERSRDSQSASLTVMLRGCVDRLWNELPLSIVLDSQQPIVRSLHAKFHKQVFSLIAQGGKHEVDKKWGNAMLQSPSADHKAASTRIPASVQVYKRWIMAALDLDSFLRLLKLQRHARTLLDKHGGPSTLRTDQDFTPKQAFLMSRILTLGSSVGIYGSDPMMDVQDAMLDGASKYLSILRDISSNSSADEPVLPLAEDLVSKGLDEPLLGNVLIGLSGDYTRRFHLQSQHARLVAKVRRILEEGF